MLCFRNQGSRRNTLVPTLLAFGLLAAISIAPPAARIHMVVQESISIRGSEGTTLATLCLERSN